MKNIRLALCAFFCITVFVFATGCSDKKPNTAEFICFNSLISICAYDKPLEDEAIAEIKQTFTSLENEFSVTDGTFTAALNSAKTNAPIAGSDRLSEVLSLAKDVYLFTDGKFNPAVYPLTELWGFSPDKFHRADKPFVPPTDEQISGLLNSGATDFNAVIFTDDKTAVYKTNGAVKIDFGGILKGYAADLAGDILARHGHTSGYVSAGSSSIRLINANKLLVRHPEAYTGGNSTNAILSINCEKQTLSVSTSGVYERFNEYGGIKYPHIINPATGRPASGAVTSATVTGVDGGFADALTTALCLCDFNASNFADTELVALIKKTVNRFPLAGVYVAISDESGKYVVTNKKERSDFTLKDRAYKILYV